MSRLLRNMLDWLTVYVPVFLLGLLALGSYYLVRNTPLLNPPSIEPLPKHVPDYFMRQFALRSFEPDGRLKSELFGSELRHYPDTDTTEIDNPRIRSARDGRVMTASAKRALTNADGSEVQLEGNAQVVREAGRSATGEVTEKLVFKGQFLHVFLNTDQVKSNQPVFIQRGADQFNGDTFSYDNLEGVAELTGRVSGSIQARKP